MVFLIPIAALLTALLLIMALRLERALSLFRIKKMYTAAIEAPSVTVCIPARNETHAMTQCLERVLASDYEKLEIVVYDDSSTDDTSFLIRSFAHAGVRFIPGTALPEGWLGKNHALEVLAREASGTYIVFLDVDTSIQPTTISQLVGYMMTEKLVMSSVIPARADTLRMGILFGTLRYFWELVLSREKAPATSGSLWMINRQTLLDTLGGFVSHKNEVEVEEHIAAIIGVAAYHCLVSNQTLGVTYEKRWSSQIETSRRLLFPMLGATWLGVLMGGVVLLLLNLPFLTVLSFVLFGWTPIQSIALLFVIVSIALYGIYTAHLWRRYWWLSAVLWPLVVLQELVVLLRSVSGYARRTITWKGRSVTAPPVHVDYLEIDK